jgi:hypothetical protein
MPLIRSGSKQAFNTNVAEMIRAGHPRNQALAAAYATQRKYADGGATDDDGDVPETPDYDYAGAQAAGVQPDERGHLPDTFKLPNHITFSDESNYHGVNGAQGGHWSPLDDEGKRWSFTPGATNLQNYTPEQLQSYFKQYEPDSVLILPGYNSPVGYRSGGRVRGGFTIPAEIIKGLGPHGLHIVDRMFRTGFAVNGHYTLDKGAILRLGNGSLRGGRNVLNEMTAHLRKRIKHQRRRAA